jgi:nitroimidazol reductase NimA-like FMN-containing flavoprotein (pyridoxamine 5'-phosphate oxidase superfamily)
VKRFAKRAAYDRNTIYGVLDAARFCHIGHMVAERPVVIPTLHWRIGDSVYWHGSAASRMLKINQSGGEICLCATIMDSWVLARSAFNHSANYRSVMCFGVPAAVTDPNEKVVALRAMMDRHFPGRWDLLRPIKEHEIEAMAVLSMPIEEASAKVAAAGVEDDTEDLEWPVWAGVLPLEIVPGRAIPASDVGPELAPPAAW